MDTRIDEANFVLMVCTEAYRRRVMRREEPGKGLGVRWEGGLIFNRIYYDKPSGSRFIPILLPGSEPAHIPNPVQGHSYYRITTFDLTDPGFEGLLRHLTGQPLTPPPVLGMIPTLPPRPRPRPSPGPLPPSGGPMTHKVNIGGNVVGSVVGSGDTVNARDINNQGEMSQEGAPTPTVGIITALPHESAAVRAILGDPPRIDVSGSGGGRTYWMGEIPPPRKSVHCVVIAQAGMGNNIASIRASLLLSCFPSVQSIIMCGIAGGIPHPAKADDHVRLGDIVVSNIKGVVQYDFIKRTIKKKKTDVPEEVRAAPHRPARSCWMRCRRWSLTSISASAPGNAGWPRAWTG